MNPTKRMATAQKRLKQALGVLSLTPQEIAPVPLSPQLIKKNQTQLPPEIDRKLLSLFSHGMSYRDMKYHIHDLYGIEVSTGAITAITDQLLPELKEWQHRPLESHYPIVWMDAIHYKIKEDGRYISKAIYTLLGLNVEGQKEILSIYLSDNESASYWLSLLTELQNRGVEIYSLLVSMG